MSSNVKSNTLRSVIAISIRGESEGDIEAGLTETVRKIKQGYTSGFDRNESGEYSFSVSDEQQTKEERMAIAFGKATLFYEELLTSVETLTGIVEEHGARTLADLMYLQLAILKDGFIDHYPGESSVLDIASALPSGEPPRVRIVVAPIESTNRGR